MSRRSSAQAYTDQNTCSYVNRKTTISQVLVYIIYSLFNLVSSKVLLCSRTRATDRHRITGTTRLDNMLKNFFFQLINSIDIPLGTKPRNEPTDLHAKPMLYFKPTFLYSNSDQISATVQDLKIRVQVVAPHLS